LFAGGRVPDLSVDQNQVSGLSPEFARAYQVSVQAERKPIQALEQQKEKLQEKVNLLQDLVSRADGLRQILPSLGTPFAMREISFTSDDPKVITGTADKSIADIGKHDLEISQLASGPSALTNRFPDPNETHIGTGYLTFITKNGDTQEIFIDYDNSTLEGIARSINQAKMGITASVVNDVSDPENSYRLLISSSQVGAQNDVNYPEFYFSGGEEDFFIEEKKDAGNAVIKYRGVQVESPTNEIKDLIPGAVLNLKGVTDSGRPITVTLEQDVPQTTVKVKDLVDKTNQILSFIQEQNAVDEKTDTSRTLGGDYALRLAEERIRSALRENFLGQPGRSVQALSDIGIQMTRKGTLTFDEKKFTAALEKNFDDVVALISGDGTSFGVIPKLGRAIASLSAPGTGLLSSQKKNFDNQIQTINKNIDRTEKIAEAKAKSLKESLSRAQAAVQAIQSQGGAIANSVSSAIPSVNS
jgi:flagellar hook-associated protein 2